MELDSLLNKWQRRRRAEETAYSGTRHFLILHVPCFGGVPRLLLCLVNFDGACFCFCWVLMVFALFFGGLFIFCVCGGEGRQYCTPDRTLIFFETVSCCVTKSVILLPQSSEWTTIPCCFFFCKLLASICDTQNVIQAAGLRRGADCLPCAIPASSPIGVERGAHFNPNQPKLAT